jgi:hypothetical protein
MLAGPSDAGLFEPGVFTANSLLQATTALLFHRDANILMLIVQEALKQLSEESFDAFDAADEALAPQADEFHKDATD